MLTLHATASPEDQRERLAGFDPLAATWVVSDLKSKLDLNREFLGARDFLPGEAVLRASELWKILIGRLRPEFQLVSREFASALIAEALSENSEAWARAPGSAGAAYEYMGQLMPLLAHPEGAEIAAAWLEKNPEADARWGRWHRLARELWERFVDEGFLAPPWAAGLLVNEPDLHRAWKRPLVFDLGAEMTQVEADLIVALSAETDVAVIVPAPAWAEEYRRTLQPYEIFEKRLGARRTSGASLASAPTPAPRPSYRKRTTMIAEAKEAVAQARAWIGAGAKPADVAVVAPDIETYWPALAAYFDVEGVATQKDRVARLHSFPDVARWLAGLRLRTGAHAEADLELCLFEGPRPDGALDFDRFKTLFTAVYGREDFGRSPDVAALFAAELDESRPATREEFVAWALKQASDDMDSGRLEQILRRLYAEAPEPTTLTAKRWVDYVSQIAARSEAAIAGGDPAGVAILNLISAENSPCTKMIVLGLTESALRQGAETNVLFADALSLAAEFGFYLPHADRAKLEFEARWLIEGSHRELALTAPETDFGGAIQAPAWIWVRGEQEARAADGAGGHAKAEAPLTTRWDELQRARPERIARERGWPAARASLVQDSILEDLALKPLPNYGGDLPLGLSASAIEDYLKCPFIFAAKRVFRLSDMPNLDLDVDAATRGKLMHALFERLLQEPFQGERAHGELEAIVEEARASSETELADERLWPSLKARHVELAKRFLAHEREWRARFPETKTVGREVVVAGFVDPATGLLTAEAPATEDGRPAPAFRGFIDRVDFDERGFAAVIDYKSSLYGVSSFGSWIENDRLQLLLYAQALERGLTPLPARPVANAAYFVARSLNRDAGFKIKDVEQGLFEIADRKRNQATTEQIALLQAAVADKNRGVAARLRAGDFTPNPKDVKECVDCRWSQTCRAPHLNG